MAEHVKISDILKGSFPEGSSVSISGWIYRTRSKGKIIFIVTRDGSGVIQTPVFKENVSEEEFRAAKKALIESSINLSGDVVRDERAPGGYEVHVRSIRIVDEADVFPITRDMSEEHLLNNRHLWIRSQKMNRVFKVKAALLRGAREWFHEDDFFEMTPPIITTNACEGGTTLFKLDYFGTDAYLSQSAQMYLEALSFSIENVYSLTPSFRAEKSKTRRHLIEYWHLEGEEAWVDNRGNMAIQEELITAMVQYALKEAKSDLEFLKADTELLKDVEPPFERITYSEALNRLVGSGMNLEWGDDFGAIEERELTREERKPIFVTNYPVEVKPFYMKMGADGKTYECADLLAPQGFGEIIGGSERETDLNALIERLNRQEIPIENYRWYLDLRRYGSVPHSGFGLGLERVVMWVCNLDHIRDATPFPRTINRAYP